MPTARTKPRTARPRARAAPPVRPLAPPGALAISLLDLARQHRPLIYVARDSRDLAGLADLLRAFAPGRGVAILPEWDRLPYEASSPSRGAMGARAAVLRWLTDADNPPDLVLTTAPALIQRVPPPEVWADARVEIRVGDAIDPEEVVRRLVRLGYSDDERVDEPGEVGVRGRVIDVFPAAAPRPCRIEHEDGRVTAIRSYDPVSQRSIAASEVVVADPATEAVPRPDWRDDALPSGTARERALARLYPQLCCVTDYAPTARLAVAAGIEPRADAFFEQIAEGQEAERGDRPGHDPEDRLYLDADSWAALLGERTVARLAPDAPGIDEVPAFRRSARPGPALAAFLRERAEAGDRVLLAGPAGPLRTLVRRAGADREVRPVADWGEALAGRPGEILSLAAPLNRGFRLAEAAISVVAAADLLGTRGQATGAARAPALPIGDVDLRVGDVAIDRDNGLCVFEGLEPVATGQGIEDALRLRFAGDDTLLVPVSQADRIWRYASEEGGVKLDRLEGSAWAKRRVAAEAAVAQAARALVAEAEARDRAEAEALAAPERDRDRFAAGFGFNLTPDQAAAVDAVEADLASGRPMDRLVCGDVGFGKTEVALRAAAEVLFAGRQVAIVAPTTVLVRQHVETFRRRFARFGIRPEQLSRLASAADAKRVKAGLADGSVRLVIGTQAIAGKGVQFRELGLVVIDEEHRFGARQKETLRALGGHVLTLTATPIPRTLQTALVGLQDLSVIATPPTVRQPIRTVIAPYEPDGMRAALLREHRRAGQSFVVCPRIEDIAPLGAELARSVPDLSVAVAHGELPADEMDDTMVRFADGQVDVLLATNIVENGLDVPRANTMVVWKPDRFGLAQLHQLRGRVGRGERRGIVHLLHDPDEPLPPATEARLRTLEALDRLGAGFAVSARDLDLRGAGDLVGDVQAGHVKLIGLGLYQHLLELALRAAKGEVAEDWTPEIALGLSGAVPDDYVPEPELRLGLYVRALRMRDPEEVDALAEEVDDRFGPPPDAVHDLIQLTRLRVACARLGIAHLGGGPNAIAADLRPGLDIPIGTGDGLDRRGQRILLRPGHEDPRERVRLAVDLVNRLAEAAETDEGVV